MAKVFEKTKMLTDAPFHYCPGCTHGIAHRLVAEVLEEIGAEGHWMQRVCIQLFQLRYVAGVARSRSRGRNRR